MFGYSPFPGCSRFGSTFRRRQVVAGSAIPLFPGCLGLYSGAEDGPTDTESMDDDQPVEDANDTAVDHVDDARPIPGDAAAVEFFVATDGDDDNDGSEDAPFQTITAARDAVRNLVNDEGYPTDGVTVTLREGTYRWGGDEDAAYRGPVRFGSADGGSPDAPIVYRGAPGELVRLVGGVELSTDGFESVSGTVRDRLPAEVREEVHQFDLSEQSITGYGRVGKAGFGVDDSRAPPDLFVDDRPMRLARWPNDDWVSTGIVHDGGGEPRDGGDWDDGAVFEYEDDRPERWASINDVWMMGYWGQDWAHGNLEIAAIDLNEGVIETADASFYGVKENRPYYYYNVLEELTEPGEFYIDQESKMLYLYPPEDIGEARVTLPTYRRPMFEVRGTDHLRFANLTFAASRDRAVDVRRSENVVVDRCTIQHVTNDGAWFSSCTASGIRNTSIASVGATGVTLRGGSRSALVSGECFVENSEIRDVGRFERTYAPAIQLGGVGNVVEHCYLHDAPHAAILYSGNDHRIERNEISHVCKEASDVGAVYNGRDWTQRGTEIRHNYFHHIENDFLGGVGQIAIYFDDLLSGDVAEGNVIYDVQRGMHMGGGRDVVLENNLFVDCDVSISFDARGAPGEWRDYSCDPDSTLMQGLEQVPYREDTWASAYPALVDILEDEPCLPKHNRIERNAIVGTPATRPNIDDRVEEYGTVADNRVAPGEDYNFDAETGSIDEDALRDLLSGWVSIPFDEIGLLD